MCSGAQHLRVEGVPRHAASSHDWRVLILRNVISLLTLALIAAGCRSAPFSQSSPPGEVAPPAKRSGLARIPLIVAPLAGQPGFHVCAGCPIAEPTPKTLGAAPSVSAAARPATSRFGEAVEVRYAASIPFAFGSTHLGSAGQEALDAFVARLPGNSPTSISVAGRTDNLGPRAANARIARARAEVVLAALRARLNPRSEGITSEPLCCYIASNATAAGRADNRRVEVVALYNIR